MTRAKPTKVPVQERVDEGRFWAKVIKTEGCWNWTATGDTSGYGIFGAKSGTRAAHRIAYELLTGTIPDGAEIDHTCHNRRCVNPTHLRVVTRKQNSENRNGAHSSNTTSGIRGVSWRPIQNRWRVQVRHNGKSYSRLCRSLDEAEKAARDLRNKLFTHNDLDRTAV